MSFDPFLISRYVGMRKSSARSCKFKLDYKKYNSVGDKVDNSGDIPVLLSTNCPICTDGCDTTADLSAIESSVETFKPDNSAMDDLKIHELKCKDDIQTFFDQNSLSDISDDEELNSYISELSRVGKNYRDTHTELSSNLTAEVHTEQYPDSAKIRKQINDCIKKAKGKLRKIVKSTKLRVTSDDVTESLPEKQVFVYGHLFRDIEIRCESFQSKLVTSSIPTMSDSQLMELNKRLPDLERDHCEILDKITNFVEKTSVIKDIDLVVVPPAGDVTKADASVKKEPITLGKMLEIGCQQRETLSKLKTKFFDIVTNEIGKRDLSEEKLKNALALNLNLPKFSGYDSELDVYTFKREFSKHVEPYLPKRHWADTLKRRILSGQALILVESLDDADKIWKKLEEAFGDVQVLLQNKLSSLNKMEALWKVDTDEKLVTAISSLLNRMTELSALAKKHDLENELYYGGGVEKVLSMMGPERKRKFIKKSDTRLKGIKAWTKIKELLEKELAECEKVALFEKSEQLLNCKSVRKSKSSPEFDCNVAHLDGYDGEESESFDLIQNDSENTFPNPPATGACHTCGKTPIPESVCHICGEGDNHAKTVRGDKVFIQYVACPTFIKSKPHERLEMLQRKDFCAKCLRPGVKKGHGGVCYKQYLCPHSSHSKDDRCHVFVCGEHCKNDENKALFEKYKNQVMENLLPSMDAATRAMKICNFNNNNVSCQCGTSEDKPKPSAALFLMQTIRILDPFTEQWEVFNIFYDGGCGGMLLRTSAMKRLSSLGLAKQITPGPIPLKGVSDIQTWCEQGEYEIRLPLANGEEAVMTGLCLDQITAEFPKQSLELAEKDLKAEWERLGNTSPLPKLPKTVGGETDIMIGILNNKYMPKQVLELESGLAIHRSVFTSSDGSRGVIGGPHSSFGVSDKATNLSRYGFGAFSQETFAYRERWKTSMEVPLLGNKELEDVNFHDVCDTCHITRRPKHLQTFEMLEAAGTEVSYRCPECRKCKECKSSGRIESVSILGEVEQSVLEKCVTVDPETNSTVAKLPFMHDPKKRLRTNEDVALKVYRSQVKKLGKSEVDKQQVLEAERKLHNLGFVDFFDNLPEEDKETILSSEVKYFLPWRPVYNPHSVSTSCRLVFDASQPVPGACSLNDILAKGTNNMNNLIQILIRWCLRVSAFHSDIMKMYNTIRLDKSHWCYQLYLWNDDLDVNRAPVWKFVKTLIYGVRSSGNQAECALRKIAKITEDEYPRAAEVIRNDTYVDDTLSGEDDPEARDKTMGELQLCLKRAGFDIKGFAVSGEDPPGHLSEDKISVKVAGMKWFCKSDTLKLNIGDFNFSKKTRGRKDKVAIGVIPEKLTRSNCQGKFSEIFDPMGLAVPVTCGFKIDLQDLTLRHLDWGDRIPEDLRKTWDTNFEQMQELGKVIFRRAIVPIDAVSLDVETIDVADASSNLMCVAIYARFKLKSGQFSCQLVFARSKIISGDLSMPRAELCAIVMNASAGHVVKLSFGEYHKDHIKLTDSQVALHWLNSLKIELKIFVRNRVIEARRLAPTEKWLYVRSKDNIADMGTRKGATVDDLRPDSEWFVGKPWMSLPAEEFPLLAVEDLSLSVEDLKEAGKEKFTLKGEFQSHWSYWSSQSIDEETSEVGKRYAFSKYLIDPNRFRFKKVLRILAVVIMFIRSLITARNGRISSPEGKINDLALVRTGHKFQCPKSFFTEDEGRIVTTGEDELLKCGKGYAVCLAEESMNAAMTYFFIKGSAEVKHFVRESKYTDITTEKDGILYYNSHIFPSEQLGDPPGFCDAVFDLSSSSFIVPVLEYRSPIAYALVLETHRYDSDAQHSGVETVLRYSQRVAHILNGRYLSKSVSKNCIKCRILWKNRLKVLMGPLGDDNLKIAPAFYTSQVDLCGPYSSFSNVNKRATVKIWFVLFACCVTGAIDVRVMEDSSTDSFLLAFVRFSCTYGYPKKLLIDAGSQLVKGSRDMAISFVDIKHQLNFEYGIPFETCPVGAHYMHGRAERKIQEVQRSMAKVGHEKLSILKWETLLATIANTINNLPIGLGNKVDSIENLDLITPNRLLLGRNNQRSPTSTLTLVDDYSQILETNNRIFKSWFRFWLISCVPELIQVTKWFKSDDQVKKGDVILFLKSDKAFDTQYQYGLVVDTYPSRDGIVRKVDIEYQNYSENCKRVTTRGVRELVVIHQFEEVTIEEILDDARQTHSADNSSAHFCGCSFGY